MKKKYLMMLSIMLTLVIGVFTGCGITGNGFKFNPSTNELEIILGETSTSTDEINNSVQFSVYKENATDKDDVWTSIINESIVSIKRIESTLGRTDFLVTGLMPGSATIKIHNLTDSEDYKEITINVYQQIESVNFVSNEDIYIPLGAKYAIKADTELDVNPVHSAKSDLRFEIENFGGMVNTETGVIDSTGATLGDYVLKVYGKNAPQNYVTKVVHIVNEVQRNSISLHSADGENVIIGGQFITNKIELVKTIEDLSYKNYILECDDYPSEMLEVTVSQSNKNILQIEVRGNNHIRIQAVSLGECDVNISVNLKNASSYLQSVDFSFRVSIIDIPNAININGEECNGTKELVVYDSYASDIIGEKIRFTLSPSSILTEDGEIKVTYKDIGAVNTIKFFDENGNLLPVVEGSFIVLSGQTVYARASKVSGYSYSFDVESLKAKSYNLNVKCTLKLNVVTGIVGILVPDVVYVEKGKTADLQLTIEPSNADATSYTLSQLSDKLELTKLSDSLYEIKANDVTDETLYITYKNGGYSAVRIVGYIPLTKFALEVDSPYTNSSIGEKEYGIDGVTLKKIYVQLNSEIDLKYLLNDGATILDEEYIIASTSIISVSGRKLRALREGSSQLIVTLHGLEKDSDGREYTLSAVLNVQVYRPITSVTLNKLNATAYDFTSVGFYNQTNLSKINLLANIYPQNATYATSDENIEWKVTDRTDNGSLSGSLSKYNGISTVFTAGPLSSDSDTVIVTVVVKELNRTYTANCVITVNKAKLVNSIVLTNVVNSNIYFDSRKGLDNENNVFNVQARAYPADALNTKLRYQYKSITSAEDLSNPVFRVDALGTITPLRAGKAILRIASEDSFINATQATNYVDVFVTVQDGKSVETAFHISTANDLLSIGTDKQTMSYYYILTNNIDMANVKNFEPIGMRNNLKFTGYLSGLYTYEQVVNDEIRTFGLRSSILNLSISKVVSLGDLANDNNELSVGLFSQISSSLSVFGESAYDGIPRIGTIKDVNLQIKSLNVDCSGINLLENNRKCWVYVGGLAGKYLVDNSYKDERDLYFGNVGIINSSVNIGEFIYYVGKNNGIVGGLLGYSNADVVNNIKLNAVSGNDIVIIDKTEYEVAGSINLETFHSEYVVGGLIGQNEGYIQSIFNESNGNGIEFASLFEDEGIDVIANINNEYKGVNYNNSVKSVNGVIGGLVGQNAGKIYNASTDNIVYGYNNVGGLVGINTGEIYSSFSSSLVRGNQNIGGLVGRSTGLIENSYVQSYEDNFSLGDNAINVKGIENVGGFVGYLGGGKLSKVYSATYKDRRIGSGATAEEYAGDVVGVNKVGGLVGYASPVDSTFGRIIVEYAYTNFVVLINDTYQGLIGRADYANISNSYMDARANISLITNANINCDIANVYVKYGEGDNDRTIINATGSFASDFTSFNSQYWNKTQVYPYLEFGGCQLVQQAPSSIDLHVDKFRVNDISVLLFYYTSNNTEDKYMLSAYNIYRLSDLVSVTVLPNSGYVHRLRVSSNNEDVVKVLNDGSLNVVGTGSATLTMTSRLSAKVYKQLTIYVSYPALSFEMYENSSITAGEILTAVRIKKGENREVTPYITAIVGGVNATIANNLYIEYKVECSIDGEYTDYFTFENATFEDSETASRSYGLSHIINAIESTGGNVLRVLARPYIFVESYEKVYLSEYFESVDFEKSFNVSVVLGATDFELLTEETTTVKAGTEVNINANLFTDDPDDNVIVTILDSQNRLVSNYLGGNLSSTIFDISYNLTALDEVNNVMGYSLSLRLSEKYKFIKELTTYTVILTAKTERSVKLTLYINFEPESIQRIEANVYTYGEKDVLDGYTYNAMEEPSKSIIPGYSALLALNVFPSFADFDYIEVTNSDVSFEQLVKNKSKVGYPYETLADRNYLVNGITLVNAYYNNKGELVKGVNGEYYVSMLVSSSIKLSSLTISITAYKDIDDVKTMVYNYDIVLNCAYLPQVELSYNGETNDGNNEIYVPYGTSSELKVALFDVSGDVKFDITRNGVAYPYATIVKEQNGKYTLNVSTLATVGDVIEIKASIDKKIGKITQTAIDKIEIIIVDYVILDIGFENVYNNVLNEVFGGTYILKLSFENSKFFYNTQDERVKAKIIADLDMLSKSDYNTWYAYKASAVHNDVVIGKYYKNAYFEINSKSISSKDLYITGVQYDSKDSNQKRISAKLKYSFDRVSCQWVYEKSGIENLYRDSKNLTSLLTDKYISGGKVYQIMDRVFTVDLYLKTNRENAVPIYNEEELYSMSGNIDYILMTDLELNNFKPIYTEIKSFNGNNHTIKINSYLDDTELEKRSGTKRIGLFEQINEGAIIENLNIEIGTESLQIDASGYSEVVFGLLAGVNNGNIYNCSITYLGKDLSTALVSTVINGREVTYPYDFVTLLAETNSQGSQIPESAKGLRIQITLTPIQENFVISTVGILVGENNGYITNSRIENNVKLHAYGYVGAIAGVNNGAISSCYSKATIYSYTKTGEFSQIGGFVARNGGRISLSFVEGGYNFKNKENVNIDISAISRVGGFVYTNSGEINDCYSNVRISTNAPTAGFVYTNSGTIKNTYSTSLVREHSLQDAPFVGLNEYNRINNTGSISKSYFLKGNYTGQENQPATMIESVSEFASVLTFDSFAFDTDLDGDENADNTKGVWFIPETTNGKDAFSGQTFIPGKPTLVSANIISRGYVDLLTVMTVGGQPEYIYTSLIGANYGSIKHPYVIYNATDFNDYILEPVSKTGENANANSKKYYILANDIDFSDNAIMADSYTIEFQSYFEGNSMDIRNLKLSFVSANDVDYENLGLYNNMGLFRKLNGAVFKNTNIDIEEMFGSACTSVGGLAGTIEESKVFNVNLQGDAVVHGKNIVGGLAGTIKNSIVKDITSEISVNAGYRSNTTYLYENDEDIIKQVSYAGAVAGVVLDSLVQSVVVTNGASVIAEMAGGAFGLVDETSIIKLADVYVTNDMFVKGTSMIGGLVSENRGQITKSVVQYEKNVQEIIDTGSSYGYFNSLANNNYFRVGLTDANRIESKATAIGGLVGFNNGGTISNSYTKVNILEENALVAGGIVGRSLGGYISNVYASGTIYIGYSDTVKGSGGTTTYYYKYIGGIVGSLANNIIKDSGHFANKEDFTNNQLSSTNKLTLRSAISLVSFDYSKFEEYQKCKIGGIVGLVGTISENGNDIIPLVEETIEGSDSRNSFNELIYKTATPKIENTRDIATIGGERFRINSVGLFSTDANTGMAISASNINLDTGNAFGQGFELLQMISNGKKVNDSLYEITTYNDWVRDDSTTIKGEKSTIFLMHIVSVFEFESEDSKYPVLRDVERTSLNLSEILGRLQNVSYEAYLIADSNNLNNLAILLNNGFIENGAKGITFVLSSDVDYQYNAFIGIGSTSYPFKGTIDGNQKTISNIKLVNNTEYVGFINYASGATIKNLLINNMEITINNGNNANTKYAGFVAFGINTNIVKVGLTNVTINCNGDYSSIKLGAMGGLIYGTTSGASIIQNSYVNIKKFDLQGEVDVSAFVSATKSQGITLNNVYSNINSATIMSNNDNDINIYGLIEFGTTTTNTKIMNSWTKFYGGTFTAYPSGDVTEASVYQSNDNESDFTDIDFYTNNNKWYGVNPWNVSENWKIEDENDDGKVDSIYPVLSWTAKELIPTEAEDFDTGKQANSNTYLISNVTQLINISRLLLLGEIANGGDGCTFKLTCDLNFNEINDFTGLGSYEVPFKGVFDGQSHKISNVYINSNITSNSDVAMGFFGRIDRAIIKNVVFENLDITIVQGQNLFGKIYAGGLVGIASVSTIDNVEIKNDSQLTIERYENNVYLGGLVGYIDNSKLVNSKFIGGLKVTSKQNTASAPIRVGGLIGYVKAQNIFIENNYAQLTSADLCNFDDDNNDYGLLIGAITRGTEYVHVADNKYFSNISTFVNVCGDGTIDESNIAEMI